MKNHPDFQNILVVDDTPIAIAELVNTLRSEYNLIIAKSGKEALV